MSKFLGDVRKSSADVRYMQAKPFQGSLKQALTQAKAAPSFANVKGHYAAQRGLSTAL
jgi:hypothetical protein